ncbi:MAG: hypothetical protein CSB46_07185 [Micrococcales bacterium]|nr:MAG: hypothetical protein CSB46_07185 [Micrococcales bacterium]
MMPLPGDVDDHGLHGFLVAGDHEEVTGKRFTIGGLDRRLHMPAPRPDPVGTVLGPDAVAQVHQHRGAGGALNAQQLAAAHEQGHQPGAERQHQQLVGRQRTGDPMGQQRQAGSSNQHQQSETA